MRIKLLENFFSKELNVNVTIGEVILSFQEITLEDFRVENPRKTALPYAFRADKVRIEINPLTILRKRIYIPRLRVLHPTFFIESYNSEGSKNNWAVLLNDIPYSKKSKLFTIEEASFYSTDFELLNLSGDKIPIWPIPYLKFSKLGERQGVTMEEMSKVIFLGISSKIITNVPFSSYSLIKNITPLPAEFFTDRTASMPSESQ